MPQQKSLEVKPQPVASGGARNVHPQDQLKPTEKQWGPLLWCWWLPILFPQGKPVPVTWNTGPIRPLPCPSPQPICSACL